MWTSYQKILIVAGLSFCAFLSPISSTAVLAAIPEIATEFNTTGSIVDLSNAVYIACMAFSVAIWGPLSEVFGRRPVAAIISILFALVSAATALAPSLPAFFVFRAISALVGTAYVLIGAACIGDIYPACQRGTAMSWFMSAQSGYLNRSVTSIWYSLPMPILL
ncbi:hypothetical protein LMH87_004980 [Akanthomyces muscarius]|uniref:Major facilitator superfamily (MFS) profile domain-containing protein n=1 Tax=Akanthomyces muscarius TaxID=2231603 RepID=A0A9W8URN4_AKAMU|nr:hypothetical protein LMH87_004980 [Akanthomyces muscarius]KAJ4163239.1 hypothetical protein LMH87_004980 [Akanthomyces muscarius]